MIFYIFLSYIWWTILLLEKNNETYLERVIGLKQQYKNENIDFIDGTLFDLISECIYEDCEKYLYFHYRERMFRIVTKQNFKLFSTDFNVNFGEK